MPGSFLRFKYNILTLGRRLTDQQLWCLGCDVREQRDTLTELGWTYHPRPNPKKGCGRVTGMLPDGGHLSIWGFGFLCRDLTHGAMWLDRQGFRPRRREDVDPSLPMYAVSDIPKCHAPENEDQADAALFLLGQLAERLADHEDDIRSLLGTDYRDHCMDQWKAKKSAIECKNLPTLWRKIASSIREMRHTRTYSPGQNVPA